MTIATTGAGPITNAQPPRKPGELAGLHDPELTTSPLAATAEPPAPAAAPGTPPAAPPATPQISEADKALLDQLVPIPEEVQATPESPEIIALRQRLADLEAQSPSGTGQTQPPPGVQDPQHGAQGPSLADMPEGMQQVTEYLSAEIKRQLQPALESVQASTARQQEQTKQQQQAQTMAVLEQAVKDNPGSNLHEILGRALLEGVNDPREFQRLAKQSQRANAVSQRALSEQLLVQLRVGGKEVKIIGHQVPAPAADALKDVPRLGTLEFAAKAQAELAKVHKKE